MCLYLNALCDGLLKHRKHKCVGFRYEGEGDGDEVDGGDADDKDAVEVGRRELGWELRRRGREGQ